MSGIHQSHPGREYILVTPAKDEEANLIRMANGMLAQTGPPKLWVIIDDGSKDRTPQILDDLKHQRNWILSARLPEHERDTHRPYAEVCREGFDFAMSYAAANDIPYEFEGLIDAD